MLKHAEIYTGEVTIKARAVEPALNPEQRSGTCAAGLTDASGPRYAAQRHEIRHDWTAGETLGLMGRPFHDLLADAHNVHRQRFDPHIAEGAMLLSIKTGAARKIAPTARSR
jgi:hypothetical protein